MTHDEMKANYLAYLRRHNTESAVVSNGKMVTNAMKGEHGEYVVPTTTATRRARTLDRGMRRGQRSIKHDKQWRSSQQERSVLRYSVG